MATMVSCSPSLTLSRPGLNPNFIVSVYSRRIFHPRQRSPCLCLSAASSTPWSSNDGDEGAGASSIHLKSAENAADMLELGHMDKADLTNSNDVMKLFNDIQQNMLFLNKQRVAAIDNLQKVEREKAALLARANLLAAEIEAVATEREVWQRSLEASKSDGSKNNNGYDNRRKHYSGTTIELIPIFSDMLVRLDSMVLTGAINIGQANLLKGLALKRDAQAADIFSYFRSKSDNELASELLPLIDPNRRYGLHITHICTELNPITECGNLGDFVLNLSSAMQRRGNLVDVILPKYSTLKLDEVQNLRDSDVDFYSYYGGQRHKNKISTGVARGVGITFIEPLHPGGFFQRDHIYGYGDDFERFSYFCRAALEYILKSGKRPDVLHLHNWQTAIVAPMFWDIFAGQGLGGTRILLTCNDIKNQCLEEPQKLSLCGLDPRSLHMPDRFQDNTDTSLVNILKGGVVYANKVTIPFVTQNIKSVNHGQSLGSTLSIHKKKVLHIRNGLDEFWNPSADQYLPSSYSYENLSGKVACKSYLKKKLGLVASSISIPLIGCIAPVISESELEFIKAASECAATRGSHFLFIGESKVQSVQRTLEMLQENGVRVFCKYEKSLAHLVLAASDILVTVTLDEETPFVAMQYGAVPVTIKESDKNDGIIDADSISHSRDANAFTFKSTPYELSLALRRAIDCKANHPQRWDEIMRNGMSKDFSWDGQCADEYMAAYESIKQM